MYQLIYFFDQRFFWEPSYFTAGDVTQVFIMFSVISLYELIIPRKWILSELFWKKNLILIERNVDHLFQSFSGFISSLIHLAFECFFELTFFCFYRSLCSAMVVQHVFYCFGVLFGVCLKVFVQSFVRIQD
jgi:hypothetical protein